MESTGSPVTSCASTTGPTGSSNVATYTCTLTVSKAGTYNVGAVYPWRHQLFTVTSATDNVVVAKATPTDVVTNVPASPTLGQSVTFTATVTGPTGGVTPSGTMSWSLAGSPVTSCASNSGPTGSSNVATYTCTLTVSKAGTYNVTAAYPGDSNYVTVTSATDTVVVAQATPTNVVTNSPASPTLGQSVTFTATVTGPTGGVTPSGTMAWSVSGTAGITSCSTTTGPTGGSNVATYTCVLTASNAGTYVVSAAYPGDGNYVTVTSAADTVTVDLPSPTVGVTNSTPITLGSNITFTATVTGSGGVTPTGVMQWNLSLAGFSGLCASQTGPTGTGSVATYTCTITAAAAGTYSAVAVYPGDTHYNTATSNFDSFTVRKATPTNVATVSSPTTVGSTVTYTATVSGPTGGATPAGAVTWTLTGSVTTCASTLARRARRISPPTPVRSSSPLRA